MIQLRYPNITGKTPEERQNQMERYMRSMIDQLNMMSSKNGPANSEKQKDSTEGNANPKFVMIEKEFKEFKNLLNKYWEKVYPVGAIYLSVSNDNPAELFGGEWEQIEDTFLLASGSTYKAGSTGGEATHTLTIEEIPNHTHSARGVNDGTSTSTQMGSYPIRIYQDKKSNWDVSDIYKTGGDKAHNNMPPYLAVYVWQRTA